jgi:hypothetical protein
LARAAGGLAHSPAVDVDPGADQPTTPWLSQPDSQRRGSVTRGRCSPAVPTSGGPETRWPTIPWPGLEWRSSPVQLSTRLAYGVRSAATTTSRKSNSSPRRTVGCQRARRCQRCCSPFAARERHARVCPDNSTCLFAGTARDGSDGSASVNENSGNMQIRLVVSRFVAIGFGRAPAGISRISGSGFVAPVL